MKKKETFSSVYSNEAPVKIAMRYFNDKEDYESQIMKESEAFFEKYGLYPNGLVLNHDTFERWYGVAEQLVSQNAIDEIEIVDEIPDEMPEIVCEFKESKVTGGTAFATPKYEILIIYNKEYQDGVYQLFYSESFFTKKSNFSYPIVNMEKTGHKIKKMAEEKQITAQQIQKVCGLASFQAVYKWFNGRSIPSVDNLGILANLFDVSIDDLLVFDNRVWNS